MYFIRYAERYPALLCNLIDRKAIICPYFTFVTQIIVVKAILINFPAFYLKLNTNRVKRFCLSIALIQLMLAIFGVVVAIFNEDCGFSNAIDMDENYYLVSKQTMEAYVKYSNRYPWLLLAVAFPLSWCYEVVTILFNFVRFLLFRHNKVSPYPVQSMAPTEENTRIDSRLTYKFVPKMQNPLSHNIAVIITIVNTIIVILVFVRRSMTDSYPLTVVIILIERMWLIVCPIFWFYKHEAAVQFNLNRFKQLRLSI